MSPFRGMRRRAISPGDFPIRRSRPPSIIFGRLANAAILSVKSLAKALARRLYTRRKREQISPILRDGMKSRVTRFRRRSQCRPFTSR